MVGFAVGGNGSVQGQLNWTREAKDVVGDVVCRFEGAPELSFAAARALGGVAKMYSTGTPISLISTFSRTFICYNAGPSRKTRLVAQRCMVATSPRGAQWWACQRARCGRELPRGHCFSQTPLVFHVSMLAVAPRK